MKQKFNWIRLGFYFVMALSIHYFSMNEQWVEQYYSNGIYPVISSFLRTLLGWLPFSFGDILYGAVFIWLLIKGAKLLRSALNKQFYWGEFKSFIQRLIIWVLSVYIIFNVLWGINYNRQGISEQLGLSTGEYSIADLKNLNALLLQKVNESNNQLLQTVPLEMKSYQISERSKQAYQEAEKKYPFLKYQPPSIKSSLWGWLGNYLGFLGYYNPFTGEGQVNTTVPSFVQPFTNCHEIAHQLGYAKESEANFIGYLAASNSKDPHFKYSAYLELFIYANSNLFYTDSLAAKEFGKKLLPAVKSDIKNLRQFYKRHRNPVEPVVRWVYGAYLQNNQQPSGILSYEEVTSFMIAYYKKFGKI